VRARIAAGERPGLAGVPVVVKDNIWVAGRRIAQGSRLFADHVAPQDDCRGCAARSGAVIIGITCPEFACKGVPALCTARHLSIAAHTGRLCRRNAAALAADFAPIAWHRRRRLGR
jgi:aspartyl-tRNA(Asn)/glutamyl-tRNA(Gln) amidotransferase subunit A